MNFIFWLSVILLTMAAWGFLLIPFWSKFFQMRKFTKIILIIFPLIPLSLYLLFGNSQELRQFWAWQRQQTVVQKQLAEIKNPEEMASRLRAHLQQHPESAEGWYLLGKLYLSNRQYAEAENTLEKAHQLKPANADYSLTLAKADFFNHNGRLTPAMEALLKNVLDSSEQRVDAWNLLGVNAYQQQDFHAAVRYWQSALALVPPGSPDSRALLDMIAQAQ